MNKPLALTLATLAAALLGLASAPAQAADAVTPKLDARQAKQEIRIDQGVASGELTARETKRLNAEQNAIDRVENRAKADGEVGKGERKVLRKMQNKASRDIKRQKHDGQQAGS